MSNSMQHCELMHDLSLASSDTFLHRSGLAHALCCSDDTLGALHAAMQSASKLAPNKPALAVLALGLSALGALLGCTLCQSLHSNQYRTMGV